MRFLVVSGSLSIVAVLIIGFITVDVLMMVANNELSWLRIAGLGTPAFGALILLALAAIIELLIPQREADTPSDES